MSSYNTLPNNGSFYDLVNENGVLVSKLNKNNYDLIFNEITKIRNFIIDHWSNESQIPMINYSEKIKKNIQDNEKISRSFNYI